LLSEISHPLSRRPLVSGGQRRKRIPLPPRIEYDRYTDPSPPCSCCGGRVMRRQLAVWAALPCLALLARPGGSAPEPASEEERVLAAARVRVSGPDLLEFLRKRCLEKVDAEQ